MISINKRITEERKQVRGEQVEYHFYMPSPRYVQQICICFLTIFLQTNYSHPKRYLLVQIQQWKDQNNV